MWKIRMYLCTLLFCVEFVIMWLYWKRDALGFTKKIENNLFIAFVILFIASFFISKYSESYLERLQSIPYSTILAVFAYIIYALIIGKYIIMFINIIRKMFHDGEDLTNYPEMILDKATYVAIAVFVCILISIIIQVLTRSLTIVDSFELIAAILAYTLRLFIIGVLVEAIVGIFMLLFFINTGGSVGNSAIANSENSLAESDRQYWDEYHYGPRDY